MVVKVFFDTDVLVDFCAARDPWFPAAARVLNLAAHNKISAMTSAAGLKDVFYFARKPVGEVKARQIVYELMKVIQICEVNELMWMEALKSPMTDTEDALQLACAVRNGAEYLITRNVKHYKKAEGITVLAPPALAALMASNDISSLDV